MIDEKEKPMDKIILDRKNVDEEAMINLIDALEKTTGVKVIIREVFELETDDPAVAAILSTVFSGSQKSEKKPKGAKIVQIRYTVADKEYAGEQLSGQQMTRLLQAKLLAPGTIVNHSKRGRLIVVDADGGYVLRSDETDGKTEGEN
jgi:hypothetical protein